MTEEVIKKEDAYETPKSSSVWSSMTSTLSRDLGEFVSEVKKDIFQVSSSVKKKLPTSPQCTTCQRLLQENQTLKKKIETLQAEIAEFNKNSVDRESLGSDWVKSIDGGDIPHLHDDDDDTTDTKADNNEEDWHEWE